MVEIFLYDDGIIDRDIDNIDIPNIEVDKSKLFFKDHNRDELQQFYSRFENIR